MPTLMLVQCKAFTEWVNTFHHQLIIFPEIHEIECTLYRISAETAKLFTQILQRYIIQYNLLKCVGLMNYFSWKKYKSELLYR